MKIFLYQTAHKNNKEIFEEGTEKWNLIKQTQKEIPWNADCGIFMMKKKI